MSQSQNSFPSVGLTANEVSNLWSSYLKNSMELRLYEYFFASTEDSEIKQVIEKTLKQSQKNINELKELFIKENLTIPLGFTEEDVRVGTHKVFLF